MSLINFRKDMYRATDIHCAPSESCSNGKYCVPNHDYDKKSSKNDSRNGVIDGMEIYAIKVSTFTKLGYYN